MILRSAYFQCMLRVGARRGLVLALTALGITGCGQSEVREYRVPKEKVETPTQPVHSPHGQQPSITYATPAGWQEQPASQFRVASFKVTGDGEAMADISVIPLPGDAGGDFNNVNRWRGQVGLPPVSEEEFAQVGEAVTVAGLPAKLFDLVCDTSRIMAVILHRQGTAWFFKMTGDPKLVGEQKPLFIEFLNTFQFTVEPPSAEAPPVNEPRWTVPSHWTQQSPGSFLTAKFVLTGSKGGEATVNISTATGDGGGVAPNVNRWRRQLGLDELSETAVGELTQPVVTAGGAGTMVTMDGKDARSGRASSLIAVIVSRPGQTWFYKLMGDAPVVAGEKEAFLKFVQEARY